MLTWTLIVIVNFGAVTHSYAVPGFSTKTACAAGMTELKRWDRATAEMGRFYCLPVK